MLGLCDETGKAFYESGISSNVLAVDDEEETETTTSKGTNTYSYYANDTETTATESCASFQQGSGAAAAIWSI